MRKVLILLIIKNNDWKTDTNDPMINAFREIMSENIQYQDDPCVGIFWYDRNEKELFGIYSTLAEDTQFSDVSIFDQKARTCRQLHYNIWDKNKRKNKDSRFRADYTKVPRGRIFQLEDGTFVVCVGKWFNTNKECLDLVLDEFQLPIDKTEVKVDSHWDIGHGWSDKFFESL